MLKSSDIPIPEVLPYFTSKGFDVAFIVPTETGLQKAILDATGSVREFLTKNSIHDYDVQEPGSEKIYVTTFFCDANGTCERQASLYRPKTKKGDPRIWFSRLKSFCRPHNLLGMIAHEGELYLFNLSNFQTRQSLEDERGFLRNLLADMARRDDNVAGELLTKLIAVYRKGFIRSVIAGDTGVGMTLEKQLGIAPNPDKAPDYRGIELKTKRGKTNRSTLFTQVPDWSKSKIGSATDLIDTYGYWNDQKQRYDMNVTVRASAPNPQGLFLSVDDDTDTLHNLHINSENREVTEVVLWELKKLRDRLEEKHKETFWIGAHAEMRDADEYFNYFEVIHTHSPISSLLGLLIEESIITVDYLMHRRVVGGKKLAVRSRGVPFKIHPRNLKLLMPEPSYFNLADFD